jgi:hypothetical protein
VKEIRVALRRMLMTLAVALGLTGLLAPDGEGAILRRVQAGTQAVTSGTTANVTLPDPVASTASAFVTCSQRTTTNNASQAQRVTCNLTSTSNLAIDGGNATTSGVTVNWSVSEFSEGVTVTRGQQSIAAATASANVAVAVDCTKSFVIPAGVQTPNAVGTVASSAGDQRHLVRMYLASDNGTTLCTSGTSTSLRIERGDATDATVVGWQVVTYEGATVQRFNGTTIAASGTSATTPGSGAGSFTAVDTSKSLLLFTYSTPSTAQGNEGLWATRGNFATYGTSATQATFTRAAQANTNAITIAWEVVTFNDGTTIQHNTTVAGNTFTSGSATLAVTVASVDRTTSIPFSSFSGGVAATATNFENVSASSLLTAATTLTFTRGETSTTVQPTVNWSLVSFYRCKDSGLCHVGMKALPSSVTVTWSAIFNESTVANSCAATANDQCHALVVIAQADSGDITFTPTNGISYTANNFTGGGACTFSDGVPSAANPCVLVAGTGTGTPVQTITRTGLTGGQRYVVKVFPRPVHSGTTTYLNLANTISQVSAVLPSGSQPWTYVSTGGASLNAPIAGNDGRLYATSNGNKVLLLDNTGSEIAPPIVTNGAPQGMLSWFPVSDGVTEAVVGTDDKGWVFSFNATTGALNWRKLLDTSNTLGTGVRPSISAQIAMFSDFPGYMLPVTYPITLTLSATSGTVTVTSDLAVFKASDVTNNKVITSDTGTGTITGFTSSTQVTMTVTDPFPDTTLFPYSWTMTADPFTNAYNSPTFGNYTGDVLFVTTRGGGTINNKVLAVKATDGSTLWTFSPNTAFGLAMDQVTGTPAVDYARNRLYITSLDGALSGQATFWVIDTTNGQASAPAMFVDVYFNTVDVLGSPLMAYDSMSVYYSANDGTLAAESLGPVAAGGTPLKWVFNQMGGVGVGEVVGGAWEDYFLPGRLYMTVLDGNLWCVQDNGSGAGKCGVSPDTNGAWTTNPRKPVGAGLGAGNGTGTATQPLLLEWLFLAGSDGTLYQVDPATGESVNTIFTLENGTLLGDMSTDEVNDKLYVGTTGGRIFRYNLTSGGL